MKNHAPMLYLLLALCPSMQAGSSDAKNVHQNKLLKSVTIIAPTHETTSKSAEDKLAEAAASVSRAIQDLAAVERANAEKPAIVQPIAAITPEMEDVASVDYQGPVEPLLRRIAHVSGLSFKALGHAPGTDIMVSLYSRRVPITDLLRDVSFQIQKQAMLVLDPKTMALELHYQPLTHS